jgi:hypothetical protein
MVGLPQVAQLLKALFPPQVAAVVIAVLIVLMAPLWLKQVRVRQVRGAMRTAARAASKAERAAAIEAAFERAQRAPERLSTLAEEAHKLELVHAWERAIDLLEQVPGQAAEVRRLRGLRAPTPRPTYTHPLAAASAIRELVEAGMVEEARLRLAEARAKFPTDPDLAELAARVQGAPAA